MQQPQEKFGIVYVTKLDPNGNDAEPAARLAGVLFSNWDHQWYDQNRSVHPLVQQHLGKPFYLEMKLKTRNLTTGEEGFYMGRLLLPFVFGEVPLPDMESIPYEDSLLLEFLKEVGIIKGIYDPKASRFKKMYAATLTSFIAPGMKLSNCRGLSKFFYLVIYLDDFLEEHKFFKYSELSNVKDTIHEIMNNGKETDWGKEELLNEYVKDDEGNGFFAQLINYVRHQSKLINEKGLKFGINPKYLVQRYLQWIDAMMLESCWELTEKYDECSPLYKRLQGGIRNITISTHVAIEYILLEKGVELSDKIRNTLLINKFYDLIAEQTGRVNDIFSFYKEICAGQVANSIYLLQVRNGLTVEQALQQVIDITNTITKEVCEIGELLLEVFVGHEEVTSLVEIGKSVMYGHMKWYSYSRRYQPDLVCNCIVKDNK